MYDMKPMMRDLKASLKPMIKQALVSSGEIVGSRMGVGSAGGDIGRRISRLIGSGDYESNSVATNSLIKGTGLSASSQFGQSSLQIRVKHREFWEILFQVLLLGLLQIIRTLSTLGFGPHSHICHS